MPTAQAPVSLALAIDLDAVRNWHEAVAIVLEVGTSMALSGLAVEATDVAITVNGATEISAKRTTRHDGTSASLGALLARLLGNLDAPPGVRALTASDEAPRRTIAEFLSTLGNFERLDRGGLLEDVAARAIQSRDDALDAFEPEAAPAGSTTLLHAGSEPILAGTSRAHLVEPPPSAPSVSPHAATAAESAPRPAQAPSAMSPAADRAQAPTSPLAKVFPDVVLVFRDHVSEVPEVPEAAPRRPLALDRHGVAAAIVVGMVAVAWLAYMWPQPGIILPALPRPPVLVASAAAPIETGLTDASALPIAIRPQQRTRSAVAPASTPATAVVAPGGASLPSAAASPAAAPTPRVPPRRPATSGVAVPFPSQSMWGPWIAATPLLKAPTSRPTSPRPEAAAPAADAAAPPATALPDVSPDATLPGERVYGAADADVDPPMFLRRQVPTLPESAGTGPVDLMLLVDETGQVLQVRMNPADAKIRDSVILPAAKAWQFRPAMKDGQPVRYWLRVPVAR